MRLITLLILFTLSLFSMSACSVAGISHPSPSPEEGLIPDDIPLTEPDSDVPESSEPDLKEPVLISEPIELPEQDIDRGIDEEEPSQGEPSDDTYTPIGIIDETPATPPAIIIAPDNSAEVDVESPEAPNEPHHPEESEPPPADSALPSPDEEENTDSDLIPTPDAIGNLIDEVNPELMEDDYNSNDYYLEDSVDHESIAVSGSCKGKDKVAVIVINTKNNKKKHQSIKCRNNKFLIRFAEKQKNRRHIKIQIVYFD